ncbi:MAG: ATP-binding protein, partial [bacterium]
MSTSARLETAVRLTPESELGVNSFFVGRRQELQIIDDILSPRIKDGQQMRGGVINVHGPWGVGKSALLQKITAAYARDTNPPKVARPSISALVDIKNIPEEQSQDGKRKAFLSALWGQLARQAGEPEPVYGILSEEQLSTGFVLALKRWEGKYTPVLVFDS